MEEQHAESETFVFRHEPRYRRPLEGGAISSLRDQGPHTLSGWKTEEGSRDQGIWQRENPSIHDPHLTRKTNEYPEVPSWGGGGGSKKPKFQ